LYLICLVRDIKFYHADIPTDLISILVGFRIPEGVREGGKRRGCFAGLSELQKNQFFVFASHTDATSTMSALPFDPLYPGSIARFEHGVEVVVGAILGGIQFAAPRWPRLLGAVSAAVATYEV
jgi:hypothetical protein